MSPAKRSAKARLNELGRVLTRFDETSSATKRDCLDALASGRLKTAREVLALHEALCFLRAHPDDRELLALVEKLLAAFTSRPDLRRFAGELADSGIIGTDIHYPFFAPMAGWLTRRFGSRLEIDWESVDKRAEAQLMSWLESFVTPAELFGLYEHKQSARAWVARLKRDDESDAGFLVRSFEGLGGPPPVRRRALEVLDLGYRLKAADTGPSRTGARWKAGRTHFQTQPLRRARPELLEAWATPPRSVKSASRRDGEALIDMAREAMVTRSRDLDSFAYGDPDDVRMVDCGDGLRFACIGLQHEQRNVLDAVYGFLTLQNGVPIGYVLASALFGSSEIAYNVFETFRGGEAAHVYGRVIGMLHALFGSDSFTVYPYQLGHGNAEGLRSGAWWFYQKLGFRPRDPELLGLMQDELAAMDEDPAHRSSRATLRRLAAKNVYWSAGPARDDVIGVFPGVALSLAVSDLMARRFGSDRRGGERRLAAEAVERLGVTGARGWSPPERRAWERWAPVLALLPGLERWSADSRRGLVKVIRAKGGRRESDYVRLIDAHHQLRQALAHLGERLRRDAAAAS
jgi:hypothetical protein